MRAISSRERRLVAVGLLLCCIAGIWEFAVMPLLDGFAMRAETRTDLLAAYARNDSILAGLPAWRREAEQQTRTASRFAISAPTAVVGVETLTQRISQVVRAAGGTVQSTQEVQADLPRTWIGVQSDLRLTISQLNAVLARFENEEPYVVVDYLSIAVNPERRPGGAESLAVRMAISAPVRVDPQPARPRTVARHA